MTVSHWRRALASGIAECDVLIVGAGICGISAALHLERRGQRVLLVDSHGLGAGASSRNAGFLMRGAADNYAAAIRLYGRDTAQMLWRWTEENLEGLRSEGIESLPRYQRVPSCLLAMTQEELAELETSASFLRDDGFDVDWLDERTSPTLDSAWRTGLPVAGLVNPHDAACNPVELLAHLARKLSTPILEGHEVVELRADNTKVQAATSRGVITASKVLIATNAYLPLLFPSLANTVRPRRGQMLALHAPGVELKYSYYANHGYEYFRQTTDGTIVVGGCRKNFANEEVGYEDRISAPVQDAIADFARRVIAPEFEIISRWSGIMGFSPDGLPLIGPIHGPWHDNTVWFCGGFTGHGMSMAYRCAKAAAEGLSGGQTPPFPLSRTLSE